VGTARSRMSFQETVRARAPWRRLPGVKVAAVSERPAGIDERVAAIFRDMRAGLGVTVPELARMLGTTAGVIETLEAGRVRAFPAWPETVRIVSELGKLHRVDARPILARIRDQVGPAGLGQVPRTAPASRTPAQRHPLLRIRDRARTAAPQRETWREAAPRARRRVRRMARALFAISTPVALFGAMMWLAQTQPSLILRTVGALPEPAARVVGPAIEYVVVQMAPRREGMRWIEVPDPRTRKSDKLRQASR
jgi:hypothetical protein